MGEDLKRYIGSWCGDENDLLKEYLKLEIIKKKNKIEKIRDKINGNRRIL